MANTTPNYNLIKPLGTEKYDVAVPNANMDNIDLQLKNLEDAKVDAEVGKGLSEENYTLIEKNKLAGVEENATADMTALEIKTEYESNADTNAYTDAEKAKVANLPADTNAQLAEIEQNQGLLSGLLTTAKTSIVAAINELFNSKANKAQEDWITPTLSNGWTTNPVSPVRYFKDSLGIVHLSGIITTGNNALSALQLPAGYRPQYPQAFAVSANNAFGKCTIDTTGQVFVSPGAVTTVYLSGISFKAV